MTLATLFLMPLWFVSYFQALPPAWQDFARENTTSIYYNGEGDFIGAYLDDQIVLGLRWNDSWYSPGHLVVHEAGHGAVHKAGFRRLPVAVEHCVILVKWELAYALDAADYDRHESYDTWWKDWQESWAHCQPLLDQVASVLNTVSTGEEP